MYVTPPVPFLVLLKARRTRDGVEKEGVKMEDGGGKVWSEVPFLFHVPLFVLNLPFLCRSYSFQSVTNPVGCTCDSSPCYAGLLYMTPSAPQYHYLNLSLQHFWML